MTAGRLMLDDGESGCERRGDGPPVVPPHGGGLSGVTWDGQLGIEGAGHLVDLDRPAEFDRALLRFLRAAR
ncbi:hypothetical protein ALI22I_31920 [Saccharothrix sp. ALI-22-I]|uniref:hypothetical protein n=1 Tax=Saccharothrix sp. ALI-22-I TaxID=1933778 RepID=UPI00097C0947|nr:hypothetical protein [Saccharothrix sp. ALI-22-I]ONI85049.1 hypothetical protein ALI22I_31920 [Saccharothrix sp. ALI-22-I]